MMSANTMIDPTMPTPTRTGMASTSGSSGAALSAAALSAASGFGASERGIGFDQRADLGARRRREAVVQQMRRLFPRRDRLTGPAHQHHHEAAAVPLGCADECLARVVGVSGLAAEGAGVVEQQLVVVLDRIAGVAAAGEVEAAGADDVG